MGAKNGCTGRSLTDISVFIPVFKESGQLPSLLNRLLEQDASKEIIVTVDEPTEAFLEEMKHIKKKVERKSFLSKMAYYEYFTFNISSWIASRYLQKCPATNGAAFAIKKT